MNVLNVLRYVFVTVSVMFVLSMSSFAYAHFEWLVPHTWQLEKGQKTRIILAYGHSFPTSEQLIDYRTYSLSMTTPDGHKQTLKPVVKEKWVEAEAQIQQSGIYLFTSEVLGEISKWVKTTEGYKDSSKEKIVEEDVVEKWWVYRLCKSVVRAGKDGGGYSRVLGGKIEIIPLDDPTNIRCGEMLKVKVLFQGKLLSDSPVYSVYGGFKAPSHDDWYYQKVTTDKEGTAEINIDKKGAWILFADKSIKNIKGQPYNCKAHGCRLTFYVP
ncbi:MAG: hypothetical protein SRB2_04168 [Desulfobacteraceae bacterium Eth-SRB2]|nr:MAG: hypothetical protein SRB2_04168 [Desulfobacteraceae bacterium Eth-SRB2]